jgi:hypothetical protein
MAPPADPPAIVEAGHDAVADRYPWALCRRR